MRLFVEPQQIPLAGDLADLAAAPLNTWPHVVFQCKFPGVNGATSTTEESVIGATITCHGSATISTEVANDLPSGADHQSLKWTTAGDYAEVPANDAYNIGDGDFTIEWFQRVAAAQSVPTWPYRLVGVWDDTDTARQGWQIVGDKERMYFQWREGGALRGLAFAVTPLIGNGSWRYFGVQRVKTKIGGINSTPDRLYMYSSFGFGLAAETTTFINWSGVIDHPSIPTPLRLGGSPTPAAPEASTGLYMALLRITRAAQYPTGAPPAFAGLNGSAQQFWSPWGIIKPGLVIDADSIHAPHVSDQPSPGLVPSDDVIYPPAVGGGAPKVLTPTKVNDADVFHTPPLYNTFSPGVQGLVKPGFPLVTGNHAFVPTIVNHADTSGYGHRAELALPSGLVSGNILFAFLQTHRTLRHFSVNGWPLCAVGLEPCAGWAAPTAPPPSDAGNINDPDWYIDDFRNVTGISTWAFHYINGDEFPPVFTWPTTDGPSHWFGRVFQIANVDWDFPSCGYITGWAGDGTHLSFPFNAEPTGVFPCQTGSPSISTFPALCLTILTANTNQIIPPQDGFTIYDQRNDDHCSQTVCTLDQVDWRNGSGIPELTIEKADWSITMFNFSTNQLQILLPPSPNHAFSFWLQLRDTFHQPLVTT